jgi:two-component system, NtrC family, nitrogen regulation sensor histidine kinase NtrY
MPSDFARVGRSLRVRTAMMLAFVAVGSGGAVYVVMTGLPIVWLVPAVVVLVWAMARTMNASERVIRDVRYFLEALKQNDYSVRLVGSRESAAYAAMGSAMERVLEGFRSQRNEQQERIRFLENVVEHVGTAVIAFTTDGEITLLNAASRRMLNVHRARHMSTVAEVAPELVQALEKLDRGGQTLTTVPDDDLQPRQVLLHSSRILVGGTSHVLAVMYDIGSELEEREMQAWQQLTRVLTHEIMNSVAPIASLAGTVERLVEDQVDSPDDVAEAVAVIKRRSEALINFVDAYRSFTRIPSPQYTLTLVDELLGRVVRLMRAEAERSHVDLVHDVEPEVLRLAADPDLIEQVLINLVLNAIQATAGFGHRVHLRARPDRRGIAVIEVEDDGPGITPDVQERIFVPFFTTKPDGSGIGLSLSRQIMRLHGGSVSVRSNPGRTVVSLRF